MHVKNIGYLVLINLCSASVVTFATPEGDACARIIAPVPVDVGVSLDARDLAPVEAVSLPHQRVLFETSFGVRAVDPAETWSRLIGHVQRWSTQISPLKSDEKKAIRQILIEHPDPAFLQMLLRDRRIRIAYARRSHADGSPQYWGMIVEHPDPRDRNLYWRVDLGLTATPSGEVHLAMSTSVWHHEVRRLRGFGTLTTRSSLIKMILEDGRLEAYSGSMPMAMTAFQITPETVPHLRFALNDPARVLPLVYVARELRTGQPRLDVDALALYLRGIATVAVEMPVELNSLDVVGFLGKLQPQDGGLRVIGPESELRGAYYPPSGLAQADVLDRIGRIVVSRNMDRIREERAGWVSSIFDVIP